MVLQYQTRGATEDTAEILTKIICSYEDTNEVVLVDDNLCFFEAECSILMLISCWNVKGDKSCVAHAREDD